MIRKILIITSIILSSSIFANEVVYQKSEQETIRADFKNINLNNHQNLIDNSDINLDRKDIKESKEILKKAEIYKIDSKRIDHIKEEFSDIN